jgi:mannosyltransferase OCH1-like enzyme
LARYCILYIYGGIYIDIKTELIKNLSEIFKDNSMFYSVISYENNHIYQGILSCKAEHPLMLSLIDYIVKTQNSIFPFEYHDFCKDLYHQIKSDTNNNSIIAGLNYGKYQNYYLFQEKCNNNSKMCKDGLDRYGFCCFIWDNMNSIIKTRYSSYPW